MFAPVFSLEAPVCTKSVLSQGSRAEMTNSNTAETTTKQDPSFLVSHIVNIELHIPDGWKAVSVPGIFPGTHIRHAMT